MRSLCHACMIFMAMLGCFLYGCSREEPPTSIDLAKSEAPAEKSNSTRKIRIGLGGMVTPEEGLVYYREFLDYLGSQLGLPVEFGDAENYAEINRKLAARELDAAFVCSGPYVDGKREFGLELVAAPQTKGNTVYYSYIIVPERSTARTLSDLHGKVFAYTDPLSNTGKLVPEYMLTLQGEDPARFFGKTHYSGSHDKSIQAVAEALVDGAAVDSLIWDYLDRKHPERTAKTRVLVKSLPYGSPPFVVHPALDPVLTSRIRKIVLNAHTTPRGKEILDKMMIERFVAVDDHAYDSVREIKRWMERKGIRSSR